MTAFWYGIATFALVGFVIWYYFKQNTLAGKLVRRGFWIAVLLFLAVLAAYELDEAGWIPHHHDTPVFVTGDWMVGELRTCMMQIMIGKQGEGYDYYLDCGGGKGLPHRLPVNYWGRLERDDVGRLDEHQRLGSWQCQRKADSLTCRALD